MRLPCEIQTASLPLSDPDTQHESPADLPLSSHLINKQLGLIFMGVHPVA
jgi:hypothetical protein